LFEHGESTNAVCIGCHRRGTNCVSQEFPEQISTPLDKARQMRDRVVRVEDQLEELIKRVGKDGQAVSGGTISENGETPNSGVLPPVSTDSESSPVLTLQESSEVRVRDSKPKPDKV
jgi:hypothetical protein